MSCNGRLGAGVGGVARVSVDMFAALGGPPALWSAESPALYTCVLALHGGAPSEGPALEYESCQVGRSPPQSDSGSWALSGCLACNTAMRRLPCHAMPPEAAFAQSCRCRACTGRPTQVGLRHTEVRGARLLHNGRPIMLRGVNRHEFDDRTGKALSEASMLADILTMKRANFNAVRCAHYPNHVRW